MAISTELNLLQQLTGYSLFTFLMDPVLSRCNKQNLPFLSLISSSSSLKTFIDDLARLPLVPKQCLLIPQRVVSRQSTHRLLSSYTLINTFPKEHAISQAFTDFTQKKPSATLAYYIPQSEKLLGTSSFVGSDTSPPHMMVFPTTINGQLLTALFDSGSTHSFISSDVCQLLGLNRTPSSLKAVATANSGLANVHGCTSIQCRWGRPPSQSLLTQIPQIHILDKLCPGIDLILGDDFLTQEHVVMDFAVGRCNLGVTKRTQLQSGMSPAEHHPDFQDSCPQYSDHETSSLLSGMASLSALEATKLVAQGGAAYLILVKANGSMQNQSEVMNTEGHPGELLPHHPDLSNLPPDQRSKLSTLLFQYKDLFAETLPPGLPPTQVPCEAIPIPLNSKTPFKRSFRLSPREKAEVEKQIHTLLENGLIRPSNSPFGAPVLVVSKPHSPGEFRCVFDYREINKLTVKNRWGLPRIDDLIDSFKHAKCFSALDLTSAYHQLRLQEPDIPRTAITTHMGHYEFLVLPFGLVNSPSVFSRTIATILAPYIGKFVLVYLDDICIISNSPEEHYKHLDLVFKILREHRLFVRLSKCSFMQPEMKYLGHIITPSGVHADPMKLNTVQQWQYPRTVLELQQFLGLANYFRKFVPNFSRLAAPLYSLLKTNGKSRSSSILPKDTLYITHFNLLKAALVNPPTLAYPDPDLPYELISDASITGCGAILVQNGHPVAYFSSKFSPAEINYTTGDQELLGVIKALKEWRCYLEGCKHLTVITDHNVLTYLPTQHTLSRRQARWSEFLSRFAMQWKHTPGVLNPADSLSRLKNHPLYAITATCFAILNAIESHTDVVARIPNQYCYDSRFSDSAFVKSFTWSHGFWLDSLQRIVVPTTMVHDIISAHHDPPSAGHFGVRKTKDLISRHFTWPKMYKDITDFIASCPHCQINKSSHQAPQGLLQPLHIPDSRWQIISMDFITGLPRTSQRFDTILVVVDKLSKFVHLIPTRSTITAHGTSLLLNTHVFSIHGFPQTIITDRDPRFTSTYWKQFCSNLTIKRALTTAFHPQSDGQTERTNKVVEEVLRNLISYCHKSWDELLPFVQFCINNTISTSTGMTPYFLNFGTHPGSPITNQITSTSLPVLEKVFSNMSLALTRVKRLLQAAQDRQKFYADQHRRPHSFTEGTQVLLSSRHLRLQGRGKKKIYPKFLGPFTITKMVGINAAQLDLPSTWNIHNVFHVSLLKQYHSRADSTPVPLPTVVDGLPSYQVDKILSHRDKPIGSSTTREYLVQWVGFSPDYNSWESPEALPPSILQSYHS